MKPTPADTATAIRAATRHVTSRVRVVFPGDDDPVDISDHVTNMSTTRELQGQTPEEISLVDGAGQAKAELDLSGTGDLSPAQTWARDTSLGPFAGRERLAAGLTVDVGIRARDTSAWFRVFTGLVRAVTIDGRTAKLTALDYRDHARQPVTFPPVADEIAGARLHWFVNYAAHVCGFESQPSPLRLHPTEIRRGWWPLAYWPMCGSHAPVIAGPNAHASTVSHWAVPDPDETEAQTGGIDTTTGPFGEPAARAFYAGSRAWRRITGHLSTYQPDEVSDPPPPITNARLETWVRHDRLTWQRAPDDIVALSLDGGPSLRLTKRGHAVLTVPRADPGRAARFVCPPLDSLGFKPGAWNHVGVHVEIDAEGQPRITWRVNGEQAAVTYPDIPIVLGRGTGARLDSWASLSNTAISRTPASAAWLNGKNWARTALITAADIYLRWPGEWEAKPAWEHLTDIAGGTGAATYFDTLGRLRFTGPPTTPSAPVTEVTTRQRITSLSVEDSLDRVKNVVTVPEQGGKLKTSKPDEPLYSDDGPLKIKAGETLDIDVEFSEPCVETADTLTVTATPGKGESWLYADYAKEPDDTARPVPSRLVDARLVDVTGKRARVEVDNLGASTFYVTKPPSEVVATGEGGDVAAIGIHGRYAKTTTNKHAARDHDSTDAYGSLPYDDADSPWRQSGGADRADRFLADLSHPKAVVTGLDIVGDPRLDLTDVIAIRDPDGTALSGMWAISSITDTVSGSGGYVQSLTVHPVHQQSTKE